MDANQPDWLHITPLHYFAESGDVENAAVFIEHGANLNARDEEFKSTRSAGPPGAAQPKWSSFSCAAVRSSAFRTILPGPQHWATRRGREEIVRLLTEFVKAGLLPRRTTQDYEALASALYEAYTTGSEASMQRVMEHFQLRRTLSWDNPAPDVRVQRLRRAIRERLPGVDELMFDDSRLLVARSSGYRTWNDLVNAL
jgi:hypothetical protein